MGVVGWSKGVFTQTDTKAEVGPQCITPFNYSIEEEKEEEEEKL